MAVELFDDEVADAARVNRLENYYRSRVPAGLIWSIVVLVLGFVIWAMYFRIDEVARAHGEVIASSRVQIIQTVDGGVLSELRVKEGDHVKAGQILARLDPTRVEAAAGEVDARIAGLRARIARLRAESTGQSAPQFPADPGPALREQADIERALFLQRRQSLQEDITALQTAVNLANQKLSLVNGLERSGDVSASERLNAQRELNEARARLLGRRNKFWMMRGPISPRQKMIWARPCNRWPVVASRYTIRCLRPWGLGLLKMSASPRWAGYYVPVMRLCRSSRQMMPSS